MFTKKIFSKSRRVLNNSFCTKTAIDSDLSITKQLTKENQFETLSDIITPLRKIDYSEQIIMKQKWTKELLNLFKTKHLPKSRTRLHKIIPSLKIERFRNSDEFNIHMGVDGNPKTVGLFVGKGSTGNILSVPPCSSISSMKDSHIEVAKVYQDFIRKSPLKACYQLTDGGFWRGIRVRSNETGDLMVTINGHPNGISDEEVASTKQDLVEFFQMHLPSVKSLYFQLCPHTRCSRQQAPYTLLYGSTHLEEKVGNYTFYLSPDSFFYSNTDSIPLLFESVLNLGDIDSNYTILDLNAGIGLFSIYSSSCIRSCYGICSTEEELLDAEINSKNNNIPNCNFMRGKAENLLDGIKQELDCTLNVVAVVNAGRSAINNMLVKELRRFAQIKKVIYISSRADNSKSLKNFIDLCHPRFDLSTPFVLTDIQPIDMYPHTNNCEQVLLFQKESC